MKNYIYIISILLLTACSQETPPNLEKTDEKAIAEFYKKYKSSKYVKFTIVRKERLDIKPSSSDKSIFNVNYKITFQQDFDLNKNLMDRIKENEKMLDPAGLYKNLTNLDRNSVDNGLRIFSDVFNVFSSEQARELHLSSESNKRFLEQNGELATKMLEGCEPCTNYINESRHDKDYLSLKKTALYQAFASVIKDGTYKIPLSGVGEEVIVFQIQK